MINRAQYYVVNCCEKMFLRAVTFICPVQKVISKGKCAIEWNLSGTKTVLTLRGSSANSIIAKVGRRILKSRIQCYAEEHDPAVVMPAGENGFYVDQPWNLAMYSQYVGKELVEFTHKCFPCLTRERICISNGHWSGCRWRAKCPA